MTASEIAMICLAIIAICLFGQFHPIKCEDYPARYIAGVIVIGGCQR
jgi:hypothetical protein